MSTQAETASTKPKSDYINHYMAGNPIVYLYRVSEYISPETGEVTWFYKGNIKTGAKKGNTYIPVEGTLSNSAVEYLEPVFDLLNSDDQEIKRSVGITVKSPRFEGVNAFIPNGEVNPVGVAKFRIHTILNMKLFKKSEPSNTNENTEKNQGVDSIAH